MKILIVVILIIGAIVGYRVYLRVFRVNSIKALNGDNAKRLPDLSDLFNLYLIVSIGILVVIQRVEATKRLDDHISLCYKTKFDVEHLPENYEVCINRYDNVIFRNQSGVIKKIKSDYGQEIAKFYANGFKGNTQDIYDLYYKLNRSDLDKKEQELLLLLSVYLNYYELETDVYRNIEVKYHE